MRGIEGVAAAHGLLVMYSHPVPTHWHRAPNYDTRFFEWERQRERDAVSKEGQVLWVYRDRHLEGAIRAAAEGETDVATVLGYPACCVRENSELGIRMSEAVVRSYETRYAAKETADFIRLAKEDARVTLAPAELAKFRHVFPYVQFSPCRACADSSSSPAAEVNWAMKRLATSLSPAFQRAIDKAAKAEADARKKMSRW